MRAPMPSRVSKTAWPCPAPIEAEDELIKIVLQVGFPQSVADARPQRLRFENSRWIQGSAMCAAIGRA